MKIRRLALAAVILTVLALAACWLSGSPMWSLIVIVPAAAFANGLLATLEDDLPGGADNIDGAS